jgi:hypothetical protein
MSARADVEEIQVTRTEKLLAVVLTAFLLIGGIWTYTRIDDLVTHPATFAGSPARDHAARCRVLGRIHRRTMDTPCVLASLGARDPGSGQRYPAHH